MKTAFFALGLSFIAPSVDAIDYEVASCAELAEVDYTSATSLTITSTPFECDSYTRFRVRNDMVLKSDSAVEFSNFALKVLGTLIVEPDVTFRDVVEQDTNGGALYVDRGSSATFMGAARFIGNSVVAEEFQGGAVFNKGDLVFEGATEFSNNEVRTSDSTDKGRGGAIYNARVGTITFNGPLTASANNADGFFEGEGGCIFNAGEIVVQDTSLFTENTTGAGGAVFIRPTGTMTFNGFATFTENLAFDNRGGGIASAGSLNLMGGSLFLSNVADDSSGEGGSGGGIFNGEEGSLSFGGDNTFNGNRAYFGGAIYNEGGSSLSPPQDGGELIFINGSAEMCPDIYTNGADPECSS